MRFRSVRLHNGEGAALCLDREIDNAEVAGAELLAHQYTADLARPGPLQLAGDADLQLMR